MHIQAQINNFLRMALRNVIQSYHQSLNFCLCPWENQWKAWGILRNSPCRKFNPINVVYMLKLSKLFQSTILKSPQWLP